MANSFLIAGITRRRFVRQNGEFESFIKLVHPCEQVSNEKIELQQCGVTTDVPFGKDDIRINDAYAKQLIDKGAFVPLRNYMVETNMNIDTLQSEVVKLIPVDEDVKKAMTEALK